MVTTQRDGYISEEGITLLRLAKQGNHRASDDLIHLIKHNFMKKRIGKFLYRNRQVENEDLEQEFLIGVALGINKARLDMGDPIEYLISQGVYRVRTYLRKHIMINTIQICGECNNTTRLNRIGDDYICKKCGSSNVTTHELHEHNDIALDNTVDEEDFEDEVMSKMLMDEFEKTLNKNTNMYNLYVLLNSGINRDNPEIKNYIKAIAKMWGGCSDQNVIQSMDKLKKKLTQFADDSGIILKDGTFIIGG